jgi:hypothetical protein
MSNGATTTESFNPDLLLAEVLPLLALAVAPENERDLAVFRGVPVVEPIVLPVRRDAAARGERLRGTPAPAGVGS